MSHRVPSGLPNETRVFASYVAMVVRNALEGFHCEHLTDEQMSELNPIIRNAICTALHAFDNYDEDEGAREFVDLNFCMVSGHWEPPELLPDYLDLWQR